MKISAKYIMFSLLTMGLVTSCSDDDNTPIVILPTCTDGIMNGDETGIDCGGTTCEPCDDGMMTIDFAGTYSQIDFMGRPGINTVFGTDDNKDAQNVAIPSEMAAAFQPAYEARLEAYHDVYAGLLGLDPTAVNYENNILGLDAPTLTGYLAADVLEVAPNLPTTYFNPGTDADMDGSLLVPDGDEVALTGRRLDDDIIDVSLILLFGGTTGDRFSGQDTDMDGTADLPRLTSDGVGLTATFTDTFPYIGAPE
ncbi:DUF4331 family protein [Maribacter sp. 2307UL18-2]|uniref:DUF4331 family protein n=1 Tax=Maribacter sp. 2307UL18-2 TaxID=3386274 RepID=UPI0039BC59C7